jgi:carboxylate-amine ligase
MSLPPEAPAETFTLGVEEEYQVLNPETRALRPRAHRVLDRARPALGEEVQPEFHLSQIETASPVCRTLSEVRAEIVRLRRELISAALQDGDRIAAAGTHPFSLPDEQPITPKARYRGLEMDYQQLARELVIFGCHVHVGLGDLETRVQVMNRARIWLAPLLALAANSPFWMGEDTGYDSFRTELWSRWPMAGQPLLFSSREEYETLLQTLIDTGAVADTSRIYWDIRLPTHLPTMEFRVTDVCLTVDESVMIAGVARALTRTCREQAGRGEPYCAARPEVLRAAHWRAARHGLSEQLIHVEAGRLVPAGEVIEALLRFARPGLEAEGDWDEVSTLARETLARGNGAARQREAYARAGRLEDVVDFLVEETAKGTGISVS